MNEPAHNASIDEAPRKKLSEEDMARVSEYLNLPQHRRERQPFRPLALLMVLVVIVVGMGLVSLWYAKAHGVLL